MRATRAARLFFDQSNCLFVALSLPSPSSMLKLPNIKNLLSHGNERKLKNHVGTCSILRPFLAVSVNYFLRLVIVLGTSPF